MHPLTLATKILLLFSPHNKCTTRFKKEGLLVLPWNTMELQTGTSYQVVSYADAEMCPWRGMCPWRKPWRGRCPAPGKDLVSLLSSKLEPAVGMSQWSYQTCLSPVSLAPGTFRWRVSFCTCALVICKHNNVRDSVKLPRYLLAMSRKWKLPIHYAKEHPENEVTGSGKLLCASFTTCKSAWLMLC